MEGKLRTLREGAEQHQHQRHAIERMPAYRIARKKHRVEFIAADDMSDHQHPREQAQAAGTGHQQGHPCPAARILAVVPVADQQEGEQARQLPEEDDLDQVARQDHAEHRSHERQQEGEEARHRISRRHVVAGVEDDQGADPQHQHGEQPGEAVDADIEVQAQVRQPGQLLANHAAVADLGKKQCHLQQADQRDRPRHRRFRVAGVGRQEGGDQAADEGQDDEQDQGHGTTILREGAGRSGGSLRPFRGRRCARGQRTTTS
jgi:hypothetical protein